MTYWENSVLIWYPDMMQLIATWNKKNQGMVTITLTERFWVKKLLCKAGTHYFTKDWRRLWLTLVRTSISTNSRHTLSPPGGGGGCAMYKYCVVVKERISNRLGNREKNQNSLLTEPNAIEQNLPFSLISMWSFTFDARALVLDFGQDRLSFIGISFVVWRYGDYGS